MGDSGRSGSNRTVTRSFLHSGFQPGLWEAVYPDRPSSRLLHILDFSAYSIRDRVSAAGRHRALQEGSSAKRCQAPPTPEEKALISTLGLANGALEEVEVKGQEKEVLQ